MLHTMSYQLYKASEQRVSDLPSGELAAGLRDLRVRLGRVFRPRHRVRRTRRPVALTQVLPSGR
jgi:hypothetical protein